MGDARIAEFGQTEAVDTAEDAVGRRVLVVVTCDGHVTFVTIVQKYHRLRA